MSSISFARPTLLFLLFGLIPLALLFLRAARQRRRTLLALGNPVTVSGMCSTRAKWRNRSGILFLTGIGLLTLAAAGPRWGKGGETGVTVGRDLVVIVDFSRSMTAGDMADPEHRERWQAARAGVRDLVEAVRHRGGHRLALVLFAAKAWVACPLTSDYDHFLSRLDEFSPKAPPPELRPDPDSTVETGTNILEAVRLALELHDPRFPVYQDILLISDGDGPGVTADADQAGRDAAEREIPVHAAGVGDPARSTDLMFGSGENIELIGTQLREDTLKAVTRRSQGEYVPSRQETPKLGEWFTQVLESRPSRVLSDDSIPQPRDRTPWFAVAGLLMLGLAWWRES